MGEQLEIFDMNLQRVCVGDIVVLGKDNGCSGCNYLVKGQVVNIKYTKEKTIATIEVTSIGEYNNAKDKLLYGPISKYQHILHYEVPRKHCNILVIGSN